MEVAHNNGRLGFLFNWKEKEISFMILCIEEWKYMPWTNLILLLVIPYRDLVSILSKSLFVLSQTVNLPP